MIYVEIMPSGIWKKVTYDEKKSLDRCVEPVFCTNSLCACNIPSDNEIHDLFQT